MGWEALKVRERDFCAAALTRLAKTMNLLRLSRANEPQSGVGLKFIFCGGGSGLAVGRRGRSVGHLASSVAFCPSGNS